MNTAISLRVTQKAETCLTSWVAVLGYEYATENSRNTFVCYGKLRYGKVR
jgi:hypothetical protein